MSGGAYAQGRHGRLLSVFQDGRVYVYFHTPQGYFHGSSATFAMGRGQLHKAFSRDLDMKIRVLCGMTMGMDYLVIHALGARALDFASE